MDLGKLKEPFPVDRISWRVGATNAKKNGGKPTKGIALAYIDARDVMERLDEVVGIENYQVLHPHANGKTSCRIGIKIGDEWVWKENGAGDSAMDAEKGAFSDSFKRAAVLWGIGRYLYDVPNTWVELDDYGRIKDEEIPKLKNSLRPFHEKKPFSDDEQKLLLDNINSAKTTEELKSQKENANAAGPRMTPAQKERIKTALQNKSAFLAQAPLNGGMQ